MIYLNALLTLVIQLVGCWTIARWIVNYFTKPEKPVLKIHKISQYKIGIAEKIIIGMNEKNYFLVGTYNEGEEIVLIFEKY